MIRLSSDTTLPFDFKQYYESLVKYTRDLEEFFKDNYVFVSLEPLYEVIEVFEKARPKPKQLSIQGKQLGVKLLNDQLAFAERHFINMAGIKGREWYRHVVYAPGEWTGYQAQVFPAIHEAVDRYESEDDIKAAIQQVIDTILQVVSFWTE